MKRTAQTPKKNTTLSAAGSEGRKPKELKAGAIENVQKLIELLQINQIELEHQNEELRITERELEESRNRYIDLFDFSPVPILVLTADGRIKNVNLSGAKMLGLNRSKLIGKQFSLHVPFDERNTFTSFLKSIFLSEEKQSSRMIVVNKEKRPLTVLMDGFTIQDTQGHEPQCQITLSDQTEYTKLEEKNKKLTEELAALKKKM